MKKFTAAAFGCSATGLILLFTVILSGAAYPNAFFKIGTTLGILFLFIGLFSLFIWWILKILFAIKRKDYTGASLFLTVGLLIIIKATFRN